MSDPIEWDRTHRWVLRCTSVNQMRIAVVVGPKQASTSCLLALRKLVPEFAAIPPGELKSLVSESESLDLGEFPEIGARRIIEAAERLGVPLRVTDTSHTEYLPMDETAGSAWRICDEAIAKRVYEAMRQAGVPEVWIEAC